MATILQLGSTISNFSDFNQMMVLAVFYLLGYFPIMVFSQAHVFRPAQVSAEEQRNELQISAIFLFFHHITGDLSLFHYFRFQSQLR